MLGLSKKTVVAIVATPLMWELVSSYSPAGVVANALVTVMSVAIVVVGLECFSATRSFVDDDLKLTVNENHVLPLGADVETVEDLPVTSEMIFSFAPDGYQPPKSIRKMRYVGILEYATVIDYMGLLSLKTRYFSSEDAEKVDKLLDRVTLMIGSRLDKYPIEKWKYPNFPGYLARLSSREFPYTVRIEHNRIYLQEIQC